MDHFGMILNLKALNQYVEYNHFKMETIWIAVSMMKPGCYMAIIDIKDAYYCVPINKVHQKYLKFKWKGTYLLPKWIALLSQKIYQINETSLLHP